jgi:xanthine dehydrogenase molybdopterin-binding subunit B
MSPEYQGAAAARRPRKRKKSSGWMSGLMKKLRKHEESAPAAGATADEAVDAGVLLAGYTGPAMTAADATAVVSEPLHSFARNGDFSAAVTAHQGDKWVHASLSRKEDGRLVRGRGLFVDDYKVAGMLHMGLVRSPYGHARIVRIDTSKAEALPGVVCTLTGKEVAAVANPYMQIGPGEAQNIKDYPMAVDKAIYQGEPVVAVVAENPRIAADAAQLVEVEYEPLPAVTDWQTALEDKSILHPGLGTNHHWHGVYEYGDLDKAFAEAATVIKIGQLDFHRFASTPLETNAVVATWTPFGGVEFFCNNSFPAIVIQMIAPSLNLSIDQIRCKTMDVGGSFGNKIGNYPYMALAGVAQGGRTAGQVGRNPHRTHAGGRPWQRAGIPRYRSGGRQGRRHHGDSRQAHR